MGFRNRSVDVHQFAMVPRAEIPRSRFKMQRTLKTAFDSGYLVPIMCEEVLPGDTISCQMSALCRLATPIFPFMDNLYLETFFFFAPCRLLWTNWQKFMGEQDNPSDSISFSIPTNQVIGGYPVGSIADYFGLPTVGQVAPGATVTHNCLPLRAYNRIFNEWFRDENIVNSVPTVYGDSDAGSTYAMKRRNKRHDYFTGCLPWTQKGGQSVSIPLGTSATVRTSSSTLVSGAQPAMTMKDVAGNFPVVNLSAGLTGTTGAFMSHATAPGALGTSWYPANLFADLSQATAATINQLRQAFQIQRLLERDARGGTRYTEIVRSHFGVISPDARLQRCEYLGGGTTRIAINPVAQTSNTPVSGTPQGNLSAFGTGVAHGNHGFSQSFTEHGYIIGLANVRADYTYQQGLRKMWSRSTRYDFYWPVFAMLGEQAVLNQEIYCRGESTDTQVFGYQERWAEYRYLPSQITGLMRSTSVGTIDKWHLAQHFTALPTLNEQFIVEGPPVERVVAVGAAANGQQFLLDAFFDMNAARPLPMYSVPGMIDHF